MLTSSMKRLETLLILNKCNHPSYSQKVSSGIKACNRSLGSRSRLSVKQLVLHINKYTYDYSDVENSNRSLGFYLWKNIMHRWTGNITRKF